MTLTLRWTWLEHAIVSGFNHSTLDVRQRFRTCSTRVSHKFETYHKAFDFRESLHPMKLRSKFIAIWIPRNSAGLNSSSSNSKRQRKQSDIFELSEILSASEHRSRARMWNRWHHLCKFLRNEEEDLHEGQHQCHQGGLAGLWASERIELHSQVRRLTLQLID